MKRFSLFVILSTCIVQGHILSTFKLMSIKSRRSNSFQIIVGCLWMFCMMKAGQEKAELSRLKAADADAEQQA